MNFDFKIFDKFKGEKLFAFDRLADQIDGRAKLERIDRRPKFQ
jgi:hypothetical protein